jgi:hypothetical protein
MMELKSMAVTMPEVAGHPNRAAFQGVLTMVDVPSQRSPSGAKGHLVVLTRRAAEAALPSLMGMALDYSPSLDRHDVRRKVGVITQAEIVGRNLEVGGYLFARDFPEIVLEIAKASSAAERRPVASSVVGKTGQIAAIRAQMESSGRWAEGYRLETCLRVAALRILSLTAAMHGEGVHRMGVRLRPTIRAEASMATAGVAGLGLSYEVTNVQLADERAQVWTLEKVTFTGAAILRRDKAAYQGTWIELAGSQ